MQPCNCDICPQDYFLAPHYQGFATQVVFCGLGQPLLTFHMEFELLNHLDLFCSWHRLLSGINFKTKFQFLKIRSLILGAIFTIYET